MSARDVASLAVEAWQKAALTGDWSSVVNLLAEDVCITMPFKGKWQGEKHGVTEAHELFRHAAEDLQIRLDQELRGPILHNGPVFSVELLGKGTVGGEPATVPICLWIEIAGERVAAIREYVGDPA